GRAVQADSATRVSYLARKARRSAPGGFESVGKMKYALFHEVRRGSRRTGRGDGDQWGIRHRQAGTECGRTGVLCRERTVSCCGSAHASYSPGSVCAAGRTDERLTLLASVPEEWVTARSNSQAPWGKEDRGTQRCAVR